MRHGPIENRGGFLTGESVMGKQYNSVSEMVRDTCSPEFADELDAQLAEKNRQWFRDLLDAYQQLAYLWNTTGSCPCGARLESPNTHSHVTGCPTGKAAEMFPDESKRGPQ
jgi:hypothetical protein